MTDSVLVHVDIDGETRRAGTAYFSRRSRRLSTTFTYAPEFLALESAYSLDPSLPLTSGSIASSAALPGAFSDAAPDRWGRNLIAKRLAAFSRADGSLPAQPSDVDFLLGVSDATRQGALRFADSEGGPFLHSDTGVPKLIELPELLRASDSVARDSGDLDAIKRLLDAGTGSLGGARPKASVRDGDRLHIAKFPHPEDQWDVMAWEKTALDLASRAGIDVPRSRLIDVDLRHVLLLERFDRTAVGRVGYISAMTMIEAEDGDHHDYTEVAESLTDHGASVRADLRQLWRRIAFSVAIHNTDDHLRNHGFLRGAGGWLLSPAFDINPNPDSRARRTTTIAGADDPRAEVAALMDWADAFDLSEPAARAVLDEVAAVVGTWRSVAAANGVDDAEIDRFGPAFESGLNALATSSA